MDAKSGTLILIVTDVVVPAPGNALELSRALQAQSRAPGLLGLRWRLNWETRLVRAAPLILLEEMGATVAFKPAGPPLTFASDGGERLVLERDGRAVLTRLNGSRDLFDPQGRLLQRDLRNGNGIALRYGANGRLARVDGPRGSFLQFTTDAAGRLTAIQTSTGATIRYAYTNDALTEVQLNARPPVRYAYGAGGALARIESAAEGAVDFVYDGRGRVVGRRGADGSQERWEYDDAAHRRRYVDATGAVTTTQWTQDGRRAEMTDPLGFKTVIAYDTAGRTESVTGATGATARVAYDALGRTVAVQGPQGQVTKFEYLGQTSRPKTITHADGARESLEYDNQLNLKSVSVGNQPAAAFTYQPDGRLASAEGLDAPGRRLSYDAQGRLQGWANALGHRWQVAYDARGNPVREVNPLGGVTTRQWDAQDRLVSETDPSGGTTRYEYDAGGRLTRLIDPAGATTQYQYDALGRLTGETDAAGQVTRYQHDAAGRLVGVTDAGGTESFRYDAAGNVKERTDRLGRIIRYERDPTGRPIREQRSTGLDIRYRYDARGQLAGVEDSSGAKLELQRDPRGQVIATRDAFGATTQHQIDARGTLVAERDARGQVTRFAYTPHGSLARVHMPSGETAEYRYDAAGRLVEAMRPSGGVRRFAYDGLDNVVQDADSVRKPTARTYDAAGRLIATTDGAGRVTRYIYDRAGRMAETRGPDGKRIAYRYDASGNLLEADDGTFPVRYQYDAAGRLLRTEYPALKKAVAYEYNAQGLRTKLIDADGRVTSYEYNAEKQLVAIVLPTGKRIGLSYDPHERVQQIKYPNGLTGRWDYDAAGRVAAIGYVEANGTPVDAWAYRYDPAGNVMQQKDGRGRVTSFAYDPAGQLTEAAGAAGAIRYRYGRGGNRLAVEEPGGVTAYRSDQGDRLIQAGPEQLAYDANGNVVSRQSPAGTTTYQYDAEDRLVRVRLPDGAITTFGYAPTGERVWRQDAEGRTYYVYDGPNLIQELDDNGNTKAAYVHGPGIDQPLAMLHQGEAYYYHADRLGSVSVLTNDEGRSVLSYDYDAFGTITGRRGSLPNPFSFTGREFDARIGLYYYRARYYDAKLGRFLSPDPDPGELSNPLTLHPYVYAGNDPVNFVDESGRSRQPAGSRTGVGGGGRTEWGRPYVPPGRRPAITPPRPWEPRPQVSVPPPPPPSPPPPPEPLGQSGRRGRYARVEQPPPLLGPKEHVYGHGGSKEQAAANVRRALDPVPGGRQLGTGTGLDKMRGLADKLAGWADRIRQGIRRGFGPAIIIATLAGVASSDDPAEAVQEAIGGFVGWEIGAATGTVFFGPLGAIPGGVMGGLIGSILAGPPVPSGGTMFLPPEQVTDPTGSQPATGTTQGPLQVTPKPPTACAAVISSIEANLTRIRSNAEKLRAAQTAAQFVDSWSAGFRTRTANVPRQPSAPLPRMDCQAFATAVGGIAQKLAALREAQARLAQQRQAAADASAAACKLVGGQGGQSKPATLDAGTRAHVAELVSKAHAAAAAAKAAGDAVRRLIPEIRAGAAQIEAPLRLLTNLQQAQASLAPMLTEEATALRVQGDMSGAIKLAEELAADVSQPVATDAGGPGPCLSPADDQQLRGLLNGASRQSAAALAALKSTAARIDQDVATIAAARQRSNELQRAICPLNPTALSGLDQLKAAEQAAFRSPEEAKRLAEAADRCAAAAPGVPPPPLPPTVSTGQCDPPLCREMCQANCRSLNRAVGNCDTACLGIASCGRSNFTLREVKAACYENIVRRCNQGRSGRTGGWCVGAGSHKTCDRRAEYVCGCDPAKNPKCGGTWESSIDGMPWRTRLAALWPGAPPSACAGGISASAATFRPPSLTRLLQSWLELVHRGMY